MSQVKNNCTLNHPIHGTVTLQEIQDDVDSINQRKEKSYLAFTSSTVQALIDKIEELSNYIVEDKIKKN